MFRQGTKSLSSAITRELLLSRRVMPMQNLLRYQPSAMAAVQNTGMFCNAPVRGFAKKNESDESGQSDQEVVEAPKKKRAVKKTKKAEAIETVKVTETIKATETVKAEPAPKRKRRTKFEIQAEKLEKELLKASKLP